MSSDSLGAFIHRLSGVYRDPQRVLRDAESLLSSPLGSHLRPTTEPLMLNDGSSTPPVLLLRGTLPMTYRGVTYNLPIDCYLPPPYPLRPPTVFVRPVAGMAIKENHRHVGLDGRVYLPYLHDWRPGTHELRELAVWMSSLFGSEPPCYAKPARASNNNPPPPSYSTASSGAHSAHPAHPSPASSSAYSSVSTTASTFAATLLGSNNRTSAEEERRKAEEEKRKALEKEIAEANRAAQIAREESAREARMEEEQRRMQREHKQKLNLARTTATSRAQHEVRTLFRGMKEELRVELKNQKQLEYGKDRIEKVLKEGEERKRQLEKGKKEVDEAIDGLEKWLAAIKEQQQSAASETDDGGENGKSKADLIAMPADTHSAQMLALSAENAAIDDCVYFLDRALMNGSISVEVFLKEVRKLSKRQFMAKAHLIKIAQTRAAEYPGR